MTHENKCPGSEPAYKKPSTPHVTPHVVPHVTLRMFGIMVGTNFRDREIVVSPVQHFDREYGKGFSHSVHTSMNRIMERSFEKGIVVSLIRGRCRCFNSISPRIREPSAPEFPHFPDSVRGIGRRRTELPKSVRISIRVAEYLTELPPRELHDRKLHAATRRAREQMERRGDVGALRKNLEELGYGSYQLCKITDVSIRETAIPNFQHLSDMSDQFSGGIFTVSSPPCA